MKRRRRQHWRDAHANYWTNYLLRFWLPPPFPSPVQVHVVPLRHRHLIEPSVTEAALPAMLGSPAVPLAVRPLLPPFVTTRTFWILDIVLMFSFLAGITFFRDSCLERSVCCCARRLLLPMLFMLHRLLGFVVSAACGKRHKNMPPSALVLTTDRPSGLTFTLVTTPA